jgi:predicted kinase
MRDDRQEALDRSAEADSPRQDDHRSPGELSERLDSLPDGHPSSRFEADGTPRQAAVDLRELADGFDDEIDDLGFETADSVTDVDLNTDRETPGTEQPTDQKYQVTDAEWAEHITDVRTRLGDAQRAGLSTDRQYTTDQDREQWTPARDRIQGELVADLYERARDVPCDRKSIVAGGLGGAGKSTVLSNHAGIDLSQYLTINPDDIKEEMAKRGLVPRVEGLTPMEASDLAHEESSAIAKQLERKARSDGKNVIWDITMSSRESTERRITNLRASGYSVDAVFVDIPVETSVRRADVRHRTGYNDYLAGVGLGGRYVPAELIEAQADPDWGSKNRKTFEEVGRLFDHWSRYDNSVDGRPPVLAQTDRPDTTNREERA